MRELIYREILEYHPQVLQDYLSGGRLPSFLYPSAVDNFKRQFIHLEGGGACAAADGSCCCCCRLLLCVRDQDGLAWQRRSPPAAARHVTVHTHACMHRRARLCAAPADRHQRAPHRGSHLAAA